MDFGQLINFVKVILREVFARKFLCLFGFTMVAFVILGVGSLWPSNFTTSVTIFADNQNILGPLLRDQAEQTRVVDQSRVVRDTLNSPRILRAVAEEAVGKDADAATIAQQINAIRGRTEILGLASGYIKISYTDNTPERAYKIINAIVDVFIKTSTEEQRSESRQAFQFIDKQVEQYKDQLVLAEERLKEFNAANFDGRNEDVHGTIRRLREQIEELKISIGEDRSTEENLKVQLENESAEILRKGRVSIFNDRLSELEGRLSSLLLSYTENHPDVVNLRFQIQDLKEAIAETESNTSQVREDNEDELIENPLYQELRSRISQVATDIKAKEKRLTVLNGLLEDEGARRSRIAEREARESELTRDYTVTRRIYEEMLERKEKARLSMTLNIEGQGITYRIQEPALPPLAPEGLRFFHFVLAGPVLGLIFVIGLVAAFVIIDPRIRFPNQLSEIGVPVLAIAPHLNTPITKRLVRYDIIICGLLGVVILAAYFSLANAFRTGLI